MNRLRRVFSQGTPGALRPLLGVWLVVILLIGAGLTACGGKDSGVAAVSDEGNGELSIALTDAEGDFVSYTVDVVSLSLTKANGTVVQTLPIKTRVDFAQYTDMTEFVSITTIPAGVYVKGSMVLDYSNAEILVENADGQPVAVSPADIRDKDGNLISTMEVSVKLEGRNRLKIVRGVPAHLTLDFDLKASNVATFDNNGVPSVVVEPSLLAEVDAKHHKPYRVRGPLKEVQLDASKFQVRVRPFTHKIDRTHRHFGVLNVHTNDDTVFEIDGVTYQGAAGLAMLANMAQYSAVSVLGDVKHHPRRFDAKQVYAGSSVPGGDLDVTRGSVISRNGDVLTIKGITFLRNNGSITFNDTVQVTLDRSIGGSTKVSKALRMGVFDIDDISVGQYVTVFGVVTGNGVDRTLNAANGYARMEVTHLKASRVGTDNFILDVSRINGRDVGQYNFAGTGANADLYKVNHGSLNVSGIAANALVRVRGHVTPFGEVSADFDAMTIIDLSTQTQH